uniref:Fungal lipase-type domain-containing protein n=1 Tax=viral metagenome TaxID=1070528 RepID=A0A6C0F9N6_9ZZZZ|tara:strand:- start:42709 stop:43659 length:951 start_codon:yes stop_codon:yes gene_type:complete
MGFWSFLGFSEDESSKQENVNDQLVRPEVNHDLALDLLRITMLVYNYDKNLTIEENTTIESFVSGIQSGGGIDSLDINDTRKEALGEVAKNVPTGKICKWISDDETDLQVGVTLSEGKKRICVVFRGSESRSDWYYDFMIFKETLTMDGLTKSPPVNVHSGFLSQLTTNNVYKTLLDTVKDLILEHPDYEICVTGHSLGGALSTLFGFMISHHVDNKVTVTSFASPRVGDWEWKKAFEVKSNLYHYRVTNYRDAITAVPMIRYYHVGNNIQLKDDKFEVFPLDAIRGWLDETLLTCWSASEHNVDLYYKRLTKNLW